MIGLHFPIGLKRCESTSLHSPRLSPSPIYDSLVSHWLLDRTKIHNPLVLQTRRDMATRGIGHATMPLRRRSFEDLFSTKLLSVE